MPELKGFIREEVRDLAYYVPGKPIEEVKRELGLNEVIKLASNENPWGPSPRAIQAMQEAMLEIGRYPDGSAHNLRLALSGRFKLSGGHFMFGNGSDEIVQLIANAFFRAGDEILMGRPSFPRYETVTRIMGATAVEVPLADGYYPLDGMLEHLSAKTRAIFVCNPNNPSGTVRTEEDLRKFVAKVPQDVLLIFDEAYHEFSEERFSGLGFLLEGRPVIVLRTFSKAYGLAGVRIGFAVSHPEFVDALERVRPPFNVNSVALAGALAALGDDEYLAKIVAENKEQRQSLTQSLEGLGAKVLPSETNFLLAFFPGHGPELAQELLHRGVIVRPGVGFGYPEAQRITIGTKGENETLLQALSEVL
ncbi:MAG: histidinol-phosphate transaminase [Desulfitobacteriaceae bacterium]